MTLREEVLKQSILNEDNYMKAEARKAVNGFAEELLRTIRSRIYDIEKGIKSQSITPENKEKGKNILTMLKSTERMVNDTLDDYLKKTGLE